MKKTLLSLLAICLLLCGCKQAETPDATTPDTPDHTQAALEYLKSFYMAEDPVTAVDYTRYGVIRIADVNEPFTVEWTTDVSPELVSISRDDTGTVFIDIDEECPQDTPYQLTATVTDKAGHSASHTWNYTLPKGMDMKSIVEAAYALENGKTLDKPVTLTGSVVSIDSLWNPDFQNITVTIAVEGAADKPIVCYRLKGEGAADLAVGNIITVSGTIKNYNGTIEFDSGCVVTAIQKGTAVDTPSDNLTILTHAYALKQGESLPYLATVTGTVTSIHTPFSPDYYNISVVIAPEGCENMPLLCYRMKGTDVAQIAVGDVITVSGSIINYHGTIEFNMGCMMTQRQSGGGEAQLPSDDAQKILSDLAALQAGQKLGYRATLTGEVVSIDYPYNSDYNNITVTIDVDGTHIQCFRLEGDGIADIQISDIITVTGLMENYRGTLEFSAGSNLDAINP